jgi:hypothetical protein
VLRITVSGQGLVHGLLGDHVGQPVGAQQVPVAEHRLAHGQVGLRVGAALQRPHDQRPLRMGRRRLRAQPALVDQRLDQSVIAGDLLEVIVAQQVGARVADVAQRHLRARPQQRGQRGAHALDGRVGHAHLVQRVVRGGYRAGQRSEHGLAVVQVLVVERGDRRDRDRAGDLTRGMPAHAVGDREEVRTRVRGILVALPEESDV